MSEIVQKLDLRKAARQYARSGREIVFEELVEKPWMAKGKSKETMTNFFDMKALSQKSEINLGHSQYRER
jgi:hypothetical protein